MLSLDLPGMFDSPYGYLDWELRQGVILFLKEQSYQPMLLGSEEEFREEDGLNYVLEQTEDHSRVRNINRRVNFILHTFPKAR